MMGSATGGIRVRIGLQPVGGCAVWGPGQVMDDGCLGARACLDEVKAAYDEAVADGRPVGLGLGLSFLVWTCFWIPIVTLWWYSLKAAAALSDTPVALARRATSRRRYFPALLRGPPRFHRDELVARLLALAPALQLAAPAALARHAFALPRHQRARAGGGRRAAAARRR